MIDSRIAPIIANYMLQIHHDHCKFCIVATLQHCKLQCNIRDIV